MRHYSFLEGLALKKILGSLILASLILLMLVPLTFAQENGTPLISDETKSMLYVTGAWLIYSILGLLPSLLAGDLFDVTKFTRSFLWAIIVALVSIGLGVHPTVVETEQANLVTSLVNFIGNSGFGLSLIYSFDKLYRIVTGISTRFQETASTP